MVTDRWSRGAAEWRVRARAVTLDLYLLRRYMGAVEWFKKRVLTGMFGAADRSSFDVAPWMRGGCWPPLPIVMAFAFLCESCSFAPPV